MRISDWSSDVCSSDLDGCFWLIRADVVCGDSKCMRSAEPCARGRIRALLRNDRFICGYARCSWCPQRPSDAALWRSVAPYFTFVIACGAAYRRSSLFRAGKGFCAQTVRTERRFRSEEHTSELQSLMRISYAVLCLKKKKNTSQINIVGNESTK